MLNRLAGDVAEAVKCPVGGAGAVPMGMSAGVSGGCAHRFCGALY